MATAKIGALITAWEIVNKMEKEDKVKNEINEAFQQILLALLPFKFIGVIYEKNGTARLGIFQNKEDRDKWIEPAKRLKLEVETGNGYNLGYNNSKKIGFSLRNAGSYTISSDYTSIIFKTA